MPSQFRSALYYPTTSVQSPSLLKNSLLMWDSLYVMTPWKEFQPYYDSMEAAEAFDVIGRCHVPSAEEKQRAHEIIEDFATRPLPATFSYRPAQGADKY